MSIQTPLVNPAKQYMYIYIYIYYEQSHKASNRFSVACWFFILSFFLFVCVSFMRIPRFAPLWTLLLKGHPLLPCCCGWYCLALLLNLFPLVYFVDFTTRCCSQCFLWIACFSLGTLVLLGCLISLDAFGSGYSCRCLFFDLDVFFEVVVLVVCVDINFIVVVGVV